MEGFPDIGINLCPKGGFEALVRVAQPKEIRVADEEALLIIVGVD